MNDELRKDWPDLWFTAVAEVAGERQVNFRLYQHEGQSLDDDSPTLGSEPDLRGWVKRDGCSDWETRGYFHACTREQLEQLGAALARCWDWSVELLPRMSP